MKRRRSPVEMKWMDRAIALAERGRYGVSPNPMVGAVVVRGGRVVGEGFHRRAGGPHAEVAALRQAGSLARGADLYVTLEPCGHFGRTPPCSEAILASGVSRVVVGSRDSNAAAGGRGLASLSRAGLKIVRAAGSWRRRAEAQNEKFHVWMSEGRPFVLAKWASTLDGKTAAASGQSRWITGEAARRRALLLREEHDAVLVGAGTVREDDPLLTRRLGRNRTGARHWRIVLDGRLRIPETARVLRDPESLLVVTARRSSHPQAKRLGARGARVWSIPGVAGRISILRLLRRLAREGVTSLLVEGGAETLWEFFRAGCVDRVAVFLAPRILGGEKAPGGLGGRGFPLRGTPRLRDVKTERIGEDLLITGRVLRS